MNHRVSLNVFPNFGDCLGRLPNGACVVTHVSILADGTW